MAQRYTLDTKIHALNQLDKTDDLLRIASELTIPVSTLQKWRARETDLRRAYRIQCTRQVAHLKSELQVAMLDRSMAIVERMDDETLNNAPLNQLATALSALVNQALKLEEAIEDTDEQTEEKVIRIEYLYDGSVHKTPPWTSESPAIPRPIQSSSVRETLGQNGARKNHHGGAGDSSRHTWLVDESDISNGESNVEEMEDFLEDRNWYHD